MSRTEGEKMFFKKGKESILASRRTIIVNPKLFLGQLTIIRNNWFTLANQNCQVEYFARPWKKKRESRLHLTGREVWWAPSAGVDDNNNNSTTQGWNDEKKRENEQLDWMQVGSIHPEEEKKINFLGYV